MKTKVLLLFSAAAFLFASCEKEQQVKPMASYVPATQRSVEQVIKQADPALYNRLANKQTNASARTKEDVIIIKGLCHLHPNWAYCCLKPVNAICMIEVVADASLAMDPSGTVDGVNNGTIEHIEGNADILNSTNNLTDDRWLIINSDAPSSTQISSIRATEESDRTVIEYVPN